jgi:hypothetical protein
VERLECMQILNEEGGGGGGGGPGMVGSGTENKWVIKQWWG